MEDQGEDSTPSAPDRGHRVVLTERGPFLAPRCSCGWYGAARRSRPLARNEAAAHVAAAAVP
ncbi:hypothetical protein [Streptomyces avicenniae]|uniref:hypothetical protein n=1 Tax=Streptomyces avicenniae TaxID=500153 RepID=UPI000699421D|nr:hypothetical protein [Streptomyces avicenniae]